MLQKHTEEIILINLKQKQEIEKIQLINEITLNNTKLELSNTQNSLIVANHKLKTIIKQASIAIDKLLNLKHVE